MIFPLMLRGNSIYFKDDFKHPSDLFPKIQIIALITL